MRILLFGRDGQLGWELQRSLAPLGSVVALGSSASDLCGDLADLLGIDRTISEIKPDVIVNAAAYTAVDKAEREKEVAELINATAPGFLAERAAKSNALLVHYSTDYVFNGAGERPWTEADLPNPINVYGRSKLRGEHAVLGAGCRYLIFRTSWVYAARGNNFIKTILRLGSSRETLSVVDDQVGAPTGAELIADVTAHAVRMAQASTGKEGLYHVAAAGEVSWHGLACHVLRTAREKGQAISVPQTAIKAVPSVAFPSGANRPKNSRLSTSKLTETFGLILPGWTQGVDRVISELIDYRNDAS